MKKNDTLKKIPPDGFLKLTESRPVPLSEDQKKILVQKGNSLFHEGRIDEAKRLFLTVGDMAGLVRIGDYYLKHGQYMDSLKMYWLSNDEKKKQVVAAKIAKTLRLWMSRSEGRTDPSIDKDAIHHG